MPITTYPNQRVVTIHREVARRDFLGIKNENWQAASRDLGPHGLRLYLYLAANANNYVLALSPAAAQAAIGIPRSTYSDQFARLISKGYLVPGKGNSYDFYEVPHAAACSAELISPDGLKNVESPRHGIDEGSDRHVKPPENIEINNNPFPNTSGINNTIESQPEEMPNIYIPKVKEIVIPRPTREAKKKIQPKVQKKEEFVF